MARNKKPDLAELDRDGLIEYIRGDVGPDGPNAEGWEARLEEVLEFEHAKPADEQDAELIAALEATSDVPASAEEAAAGAAGPDDVEPSNPPDEPTDEPVAPPTPAALPTAPAASTGLLGSGGQPPGAHVQIEVGDKIAAAGAGYEHVQLADGRFFEVDPETGEVTKVLS